MSWKLWKPKQMGAFRPPFHTLGLEKLTLDFLRIGKNHIQKALISSAPF